jgi:hypothetical protein
MDFFRFRQLNEIMSIARVIHNVNRAYCEAIGDSVPPEWDEASQEQQHMVMKGVEHRIMHPEATPETQHAGWLEAKEELGWKYGPVKDEIRREHPCMVSYADLPPAQKVKDYLFGAIVESMI